jgi:hypothetical protein
MTNALDWLPTIRDGRYVLDPAGPGRYAPVDPADDQALTIAEQVQILSAATGLDIKVREPATPDETVRARFPHGGPLALAEALLEADGLGR